MIHIQVRSEAKIPKLKELGVETIQSTLTEMDKLIEAAKRADAVIHTAVDYSDFAGIDSALSKALVQALGAGKKFIYTSGIHVTSLYDGILLTLGQPVQVSGPTATAATT